ncbi:NAD(P)/FAD-dependent oxidoreductase [Endozoicomonas elysicola]|uniref:FAD-dependent oxidoreductase n=1 Tax=Endozoicomonas elysicola TaxID=305900 RepID=A0A081K9Z3_9GAMM|nr:FAD-binding oxidoreductase [Endozoicomonas elysicola]KEI70969.1 FAD-dependent oxidoreductase [Endozoicomonas elysicola]
MKLKAPVHTEAHADSYYAASMNFETDYPELEGSLSVDVCVVGGGFSGVATALELAERGYRVAVLEARKIGWGATGRNGGQLIRGIGEEPEQFRNQIGSDGVEAIHQMGFEAVELVRDRVRKYDIQCDLKMGYVDAAIKPKQMDEIAEDYESLKKRHYAHELRLLSQDDIKQYVNTDRYIGGMLDSGSGHLHPLNLCLGEARVAEALGVQFFENSPVVKIHKGYLPRVETAKGSVTCQFLVLAGNAYLGNLEPKIGGKVLPAGSYIIATERLEEKVWKNLIPQDSAICDVSIALDYFRLSDDKRLLFGGMCNYSGRDPKDIVASLRPKMLKVFPQLENASIEYQWGGMIGIGANRMPQIGRLGSNIYFAQAYSGHGVNATHMAGRVLAEAISGQAERFDVFANIRHMTFPGGRYFRSPLLALGMLWYRLKEVV